MGKESKESAKDDNYLSEFDWIQIRGKMEEGNETETFLGKTSRKFGENPLVPIGAFATLGALSAGLWNFRLGKKVMSQKMMRLRVVAQGFTVVALVSGMFIAATSPVNKGAFVANVNDSPAKIKT